MVLFIVVSFNFLNFSCEGEHKTDPNVWVAVAFDHEEVGSNSVPGAGELKLLRGVSV